MLIPDPIRKCVVFLLYRDTNQNFKYAGTGFFVGEEIELGSFIYLVTAKHVIVGIKQKSIDAKVYIRINDTKGGSKLVPSNVSDWNEHPTDSSVDASVLWWTPNEMFDFIFLVTKMAATTSVIKQNSIGIGDEVFIIGLFVSHIGKNRNIPIARVGNLAAMTEEKIDTRDFGSIEAYLIEARSIGGLSGSPVFVTVTGNRMGGELPKAGDILFTTGTQHYLLGLIHGHWDRSENAVDGVSQDIDGGQVNMGIAIVVPITKVLEIINQPKWVEIRNVALEAEKKKRSPTVDTKFPTQDKPHR